jgi:hypothetical protein
MKKKSFYVCLCHGQRSKKHFFVYLLSWFLRVSKVKNAIYRVSRKSLDKEKIRIFAPRFNEMSWIFFSK